MTSNVDGQFQQAGFAEDRILEVHGSIHHLQCATPCTMAIWENRETIPVDESTMRAGHVPRCIHCGGVARPNILMFGDYGWINGRTARQQRNFDEFLADARGRRAVVVELGAGTAIPTIRYLTEEVGSLHQAVAIRINPREAQIGAPHISLACGALEGLAGIKSCLE